MGKWTLHTFMVRAFTECVTLFAGSLDISIKATNNTSVCACVWKRRDKIGIFHRMKLFKKFIIFGCARSSLLFQLFSSCRERGPLLSCGVWASRFSGLCCCRAQALECGLRTCAAQAPCGMWDLPGCNPCPLGRQILNHWTTTAIPIVLNFVN